MPSSMADCSLYPNSNWLIALTNWAQMVATVDGCMVLSNTPLTIQLLLKILTPTLLRMEFARKVLLEEWFNSLMLAMSSPFQLQPLRRLLQDNPLLLEYGQEMNSFTPMLAVSSVAALTPLLIMEYS